LATSLAGSATLRTLVKPSDVNKLRASDGALLGTYPVGSFPESVAFDGANIWVANEAATIS
jgi:hypothetical protein